MRFVGRLCLSTLAILISAYLLPGVHVDSPVTALVVALVLAFLNAVVKPVLVFFTIPFTIFTFGLFLIVINAFIIEVTSNLVNGFSVDGFFSAFIFSIVLWLISTALESLNHIGQNRHQDHYEE